MTKCMHSFKGWLALTIALLLILGTTVMPVLADTAVGDNETTEGAPGSGITPPDDGEEPGGDDDDDENKGQGEPGSADPTDPGAADLLARDGLQDDGAGRQAQRAGVDRLFPGTVVQVPDEKSFEAAIADIFSAPAPGEIYTIYLTDDVQLVDTLTIDWPDDLVMLQIAGDGAVIRSAQGKRHFVIEDANKMANLAFDGIVLDGGSSGGGILVEGHATINVDDDDIYPIPTDWTFTMQNCAANEGGAVYVPSGMSLNVKGALFHNNEADRGGAIYVDENATLYLHRSVLRGNRAALGGGLYIAGDMAVMADDNVTGYMVAFEDNKATDDGGAIYIAYTGALVSGYGMGFTGNEAARGGAIFSAGDINGIHESDFIENTAGEGGAIYVRTLDDTWDSILNGPRNYTLTLGTVHFTENRATAGSGGAIYLEDFMTLSSYEGAFFEGNIAAESGGAMYAAGHVQMLYLTGSLVGNRAENGYGGGVYVHGYFSDAALQTYGEQQLLDELSLYNDVTFAGAWDKPFLMKDNRAAKDGGAVYIGGQPSLDDEDRLKIAFTIETAQVETNRAGGSGGAAYHASVEQMRIDGSTFVSNEAAAGDGGALYLAGPRPMANFTEVTFTGNRAPVGSGGAIYIDGVEQAPNGEPDTYMTYTLYGESDFTGNEAGLHGGAIYAGSIGLMANPISDPTASAKIPAALMKFEITGFVYDDDDDELVTFTDNRAGGDGGAVYFGDNFERAQLRGVVLNGNRAANGGAVYSAQTVVPGCNYEDIGIHIGFVDTEFVGNVVTGDGGAIFIDDKALFLLDIGGGKLEPGTGHTDPLADSLFRGNRAGVGYLLILPDYQADAALHDEMIHVSEISNSDEFTYAYNNYDIAYTKGDVLPRHTVTFYRNHDGDGGEVYRTVGDLRDNATVDPPRRDPRRSGYKFTGWYTDKATTQDYLFTAPITGDLDLYAGWVQLHTVTFYRNHNGDGGGYHDAIRGVEHGTTLSNLPAGPTRDGYTFTAWYNDAANTDLFEKDTTPILSDRQLYAGWKQNPTPPPDYIVTYHLNDGTGDTLDPQSVAPGGTATRPVTDPVRAGYAFLGWSKEPTATPFEDYDFASPVNASFGLYARWIQLHTVTFYDNIGADGGSVVHTLTGVRDGTAVTAPAGPTRSGYTFTGWYTDATAVTSFSFATPIVDDLDLFAGWRQDTRPPGPGPDPDPDPDPGPGPGPGPGPDPDPPPTNPNEREEFFPEGDVPLAQPDLLLIFDDGVPLEELPGTGLARAMLPGALIVGIGSAAIQCLRRRWNTVSFYE